MQHPEHQRRRIAVVGSGVAGLTAAHVLQRSARVTLFEADDRPGGHAHTQDVLTPSGSTHAVDTGFIVHNRRAYPTLLRLFEELGVETQPSEMTMSVRCEGCGLEYAGARGLSGLAARPRSLADAKYLRMLVEVPLFHRRARRLLATGEESLRDETLGAFLAAAGYSGYFVSHFITPLVAAVWSCAPDTALRYPARYLFTFLAHHGYLSISGSPAWRTVVGGSRSYVERVAKQLTAVHTSTPVRALRRTAGGVEVRDDADGVHAFDAAVVATHPDQALALLDAPTRAEREVLGAFRYSRNETVLHTDPGPLPTVPRARSSWNYLMTGCDTAADRVLVSYDMNRLQRIESRDPLVVTLNGADRIAPDKVLARMLYEHPIYTPASVAAQARLPELNDGTVAYAGAYHGWGFHEDGAAAGLAAALSLGGTW